MHYVRTTHSSNLNKRFSKKKIYKYLKIYILFSFPPQKTIVPFCVFTIPTMKTGHLSIPWVKDKWYLKSLISKYGVNFLKRLKVNI